MTNTEFRIALITLGVNEKEFAEEIDKHPQTVSRWATGGLDVPTLVAKYVELRLTAETQALGYQWMRKHDALLGWIQKDPDLLSKLIKDAPHPSPASDDPGDVGAHVDLLSRIAAERLRCQKLVDAWDPRSERWNDMPMNSRDIKLRILGHIHKGTKL